MNVHHTRAQQTGLGLLGLLSAVDIAMLALTDGEHPPYAVAALGAGLGLVSLYLVVRAFRSPDHPVRLLIALRIVSAVTALPAFFVDDVPGAAKAAASAFVALTAVGVLLVGGTQPRTVTA